MAMLTNPRTWEKAVRWILVLGAIRVVVVMWSAASNVGRYVWQSQDTPHTNPLDSWLFVAHIVVWGADFIAESVLLTLIGMAVCVAVARYLRHTDTAPGRERTLRAGERESEAC